MEQRLFLEKLRNHKFFKFMVAGILNTFFGYAIYAVLLFASIPYLMALLLATITGVVFNYFSFGYIVFNGHIGCLVFCKLAIAYLLIYGLNAVGLSVLIRYFFVSPYLGQFLCIFPSLVLSWLLMNCWVFKRL
jgi:putative flippase GtrA